MKTDRTYILTKMPTALLLFMICLCPVALANVADVDMDLKAALLKMKAQDQAVRAITREQGLALEKQVVEAINDTDRRHTNALKAIVKKHGWPTVSMVGKEGVQAAFIIVQHASDPIFQQAMLGYITDTFHHNEGISGQEVALLTDRILVNSGQPQKYGTQASIKANTVEFFAIDDADSVDKRRAEMGMPSLKEYRQMLEQFYAVK